jgi:hypothetical protein
MHPAFDRRVVVEEDLLERAGPRVAIFGCLDERARKRVRAVLGLQRIAVGLAFERVRTC